MKFPTLQSNPTQKMRRDGHQHGLIRTRAILPPPYNPRQNSRVINLLHSPPVAGVFTKVPSKPTNHSKFTGKCGKKACNDCHALPSCKSKHKTKGSHKFKGIGLLERDWDADYEKESGMDDSRCVLGDEWEDNREIDVDNSEVPDRPKDDGSMMEIAGTLLDGAQVVVIDDLQVVDHPNDGLVSHFFHVAEATRPTIDNTDADEISLDDDEDWLII